MRTRSTKKDHAKLLRLTAIGKWIRENPDVPTEITGQPWNLG